MYNSAYDGGLWMADVLVNWIRWDSKYQFYPPHGSLWVPSGSLVSIVALHVYGFSPIAFSVPNTCVMP
jgi:hypothetical protein